LNEQHAVFQRGCLSFDADHLEDVRLAFDDPIAFLSCGEDVAYAATRSSDEFAEAGWEAPSFVLAA